MRIEVDAARTLRSLDELLERTGNLTGAMRNIGEEGVGLAQESFRTSTDPYGRAWTPLAASTLASRRRQGASGERPLVRTGLLMRSFNYRADRDRVEIGTPYEFFRYHQQYGGPGSILPRRAALPDANLPAAWRDAIIGALNAHLAAEQ